MDDVSEHEMWTLVFSHPSFRWLRRYLDDDQGQWQVVFFTGEQFGGETCGEALCAAVLWMRGAA